MRTRIKICGITSVGDARLAVSAGADAIGLVFYEKSPRYVHPSRAAMIAAAVPPMVDVVGVFVNPQKEEVERVSQEVPISVLQFHGDEAGEACEQFNKPYIKALRMSDSADPHSIVAAHPQLGALLLDTYQEEAVGGTGAIFDWSRARLDLRVPVILAGGLRPENIEDALASCDPFGVDVSSGVESAPGKKEVGKVIAFCDAVRSWDQKRQARQDSNHNEHSEANAR